MKANKLKLTVATEACQKTSLDSSNHIIRKSGGKDEYCLPFTFKKVEQSEVCSSPSRQRISALHEHKTEALTTATKFQVYRNH